MQAVERRDDGAFLGMVGLGGPVVSRPTAALATGAGPPRAGYATEAAERWLAHGFEDVGRTEIHAMADVPNRASISP